MSLQNVTGIKSVTAVSTTGLSSTIPGQYTISCGSAKSVSIENYFEKTIEYLDFISEVVGLDLNFEKFKNMTESQKVQYLRDIKISKVIE